MSRWNWSRWIGPIILLPGTMAVFVPLLIVWLSRNTAYAAVLAGPGSVRFWLAVLFGLPGLVLSLSAMAMFARFGDGTAAPWDPPRRLVVAGPYRFVRNPMLSGLIAILFAEALLAGSWPLGAWATVFFLGNAVWFPLVEEPKLVERFGDDYRQYCGHVPRWLPRVSPWQQPPS